MMMEYPSREFDDAVASVCHGGATAEEMQALNQLLRGNAAARDEYILRVELHARLASEPDYFASVEAEGGDAGGARSGDGNNEDGVGKDGAGAGLRDGWKARGNWALALAASLVLVAAGFWVVRKERTEEQRELTSLAVAMLNRTADARWEQEGEEGRIPRLNAPLEPGVLRLEAGLAEIIFYTGARVVLEGPAELKLISQNEAYSGGGRMLAEIPAAAREFRLSTPEAELSEMEGTTGVEVKAGRTELHAFKSSRAKVTVSAGERGEERMLEEGMGVRIGSDGKVMALAAERGEFAALFDVEARSMAAGSRRYDQWRSACKRLEKDPSLLLHYDFEAAGSSGRQIQNIGNQRAGISDATMVGCQWTEGRWPEKRALEFQSVNDRVRLTVPGEFGSMTLTAWVSVKGLDRKINSLFMSDGFAPGTIHWLIRRDGVLGMTVIGADPRDHQIVASGPEITLEKFGMWLHLAVVLDAGLKRVVHYVNGRAVSEAELKIAPPFRIGTAELGNWNAKGFPESDPFMIRNFSGAMDEFGMFSRALDEGEIRTLYLQGKPQGDTVTAR